MTGDRAGEAGGITVPYRVRFDECGPDGVARTSALLRYAQDVAWIHSERMGFDRAWYAERQLAWVVRAAELSIQAPIPMGAIVSVHTAVTGLRRVWARRRTEARLADGSLAAWMHTDWVMIGERGLPGRVPAEFPAVFTVPPGTFEPVRVALPAAPSDAVVTPAAVRPADIDPMGHVNNAAYLDYLEEALLAAGATAAAAIAITPRTVRIDYLVAAAPGSRLVSAAWSTEVDGHAAWAWRLRDTEARELARGLVLAGP